MTTCSFLLKQTPPQR